MCAPRAHIVFTLVGVKHFARLGRRKKREAQGRPRHWVRGHRFPHRTGLPTRHTQVTGNSDLPNEGQAEKLAGKVQKKVGQVEEVVGR